MQAAETEIDLQSKPTDGTYLDKVLRDSCHSR